MSNTQLIAAMVVAVLVLPFAAYFIGKWATFGIYKGKQLAQKERDDDGEEQ